MKDVEPYMILIGVVFAILVLISAKPFLIYCMGFLAGIGFTRVVSLCRLKSRLISQYRALQGYVLKQVKKVK